MTGFANLGNNYLANNQDVQVSNCIFIGRPFSKHVTMIGSVDLSLAVNILYDLSSTCSSETLVEQPSPTKFGFCLIHWYFCYLT